jgi:hypothetical protein
VSDTATGNTRSQRLQRLGLRLEQVDVLQGREQLVDQRQLVEAVRADDTQHLQLAAVVAAAQGTQQLDVVDGRGGRR